MENLNEAVTMAVDLNVLAERAPKIPEQFLEHFDGIGPQNPSPTAAGYPSMILWNPQVSYDFGRNQAFNSRSDVWWRRWLSDSKFSITIPNIFHADPELADKINGRIIYDPRLTRYVINVSKKL